MVVMVNVWTLKKKARISPHITNPIPVVIKKAFLVIMVIVVLIKMDIKRKSLPDEWRGSLFLWRRFYTSEFNLEVRATSTFAKAKGLFVSDSVSDSDSDPDPDPDPEWASPFTILT
jgi:hypothetical protein